MTDYPETLRSIIKAAAVEHQESIDDAVDSAFKQIEKLDDYSEWIEKMVRQAIREMIHQARHETNTDFRRSNGEFGGPAKVGTATGAANRVAAMCLLDSYAIGGTSLGSILGSELPAIRDSQITKGRGCFFNAALCSALIPLVADDKSVRECVTEKKARQIFKAAQSKSMVNAAGMKTEPIGVLPHSTNGHASMPLSPNRPVRGRKTKAAKVAVAN